MFNILLFLNMQYLHYNELCTKPVSFKFCQFPCLMFSTFQLSILLQGMWTGIFLQMCYHNDNDDNDNILFDHNIQIYTTDLQ